MSAFSDYIRYFDESGSPDLSHIDPEYPLFVLAAVLVSKEDYVARIVPAVQRLKFDFFRRIVAGDAKLQHGTINRHRVSLLQTVQWIPHFVSKKANSSGLQLADLIARPIGLSILRPGQPNRAFDTIKGKIGKGMLKCFP